MEISKKLNISWNTAVVYLLNLLLKNKVNLLESGSRKYWNIRNGKDEDLKIEEIEVKVSEVKVRGKVTQLKVCIPKRFSRILNLTKDSNAMVSMDYKKKKVFIEIDGKIGG